MFLIFKTNIEYDYSETIEVKANFRSNRTFYKKKRKNNQKSGKRLKSDSFTECQKIQINVKIHLNKFILKFLLNSFVNIYFIRQVVKFEESLFEKNDFNIYIFW